MKGILLCLGVLCVATSPLFAQWSKDTTVRNPVCTAANLQYEPVMCSDGHKGVIIVWVDQRNPGPQEIFVQHVDSSGVNLWAANGIEIAPPSGSIGLDAPLIVTDSAGGAIIFYNVTVDGGAEQIYAQRVDGNGNFLWGATGVGVATAQDSRIRSNEAAANNNAASDGLGGAFITFQVYSPFNNMAQYIDKNGNLPWGVNGVQVTSNDSANARYESFIVSTGGGTAVVGYSYNERLYLQLISSAGALQWGAGVLVADSFYNNSDNQGAYMVFDSLSATKNVMISWLDTRTSNPNNIYAQKVSLSGDVIWQKDGVPVSGSSFYAVNPDMLIDKSGGFFVIYDSIYAVKVQHISNTGQLLWGSSGISTAPQYNGTNPVLGDDGGGGIIAMWYDERIGGGFSGDAIFAQHYNVDGTMLWRYQGVPVITQNVSINHSTNPIIALGDSTAIACWATSTGGDIYAAKFGGIDGLLPVSLISFTAQLQKSAVQLQWITAQEINMNYYEVQKAVNNLQFAHLATVAATGNVNTQHTYNTIDPNPAQGINYYRLKEVDKDGGFVYSRIAEVLVKGPQSFTVFPNPAKDNLNLKITTTAQKGSLLLYDALGKLIMQKQVLLADGDNYVEWSVSNLAAGVYYVEAAGTGMRVKVIKE